MAEDESEESEEPVAVLGDLVVVRVEEPDVIVSTVAVALLELPEEAPEEFGVAVAWGLPEAEYWNGESQISLTLITQVTLLDYHVHSFGQCSLARIHRSSSYRWLSRCPVDTGPHIRWWR